MKKILLYLDLLYMVFLGNLLKAKIRFQLFFHLVKLSNEVEPHVVLSLTSYGNRVKNNSVSYTLFSLLMQKKRAERIVLWLGENEFSDATIPSMLQRMKKLGVEVRYCKDIRSYTKIIPSIRQFPNDTIITVDDDLYYSSNLVEEMVRQMRLHPNCIIAEGVWLPKLTSDGMFAPYKEWIRYHNVKKSIEYNKMLAMPLGVYGILYPSHIFDEEVLNMDVALELSPRADDLWLYIMGLRCGIQKILVPESHVKYYNIDLVRQVLTHDRLFDTNVGQDQNDVQLKKLLEHYDINVAVLQ